MGRLVSAHNEWMFNVRYNLKLDKQYKKDANEAKIYIDGIKARQTTRRTLTPSYVFNVCTTSHICKWDRDPNGTTASLVPGI